jgi:tripartite-type tricarboxylate transporter receptor subunit TctC
VELGYNVTLPAMHFVMGPANMPPDAVASVRNMVRQAMTSARFKELAARSGFAVDPVDEAGLDKDLKSFEAAYVKIAKDLKLEKK